MNNIINIDNSTLQNVPMCTTHTALKALGYRGSDSSEAIDVGSSLHGGLEGFYSRKNEMEAFNRSWAEYFPESRLISDEKYMYQNVKDIFTTYCAKHPVDGAPFEVIDTEQTVGMPLNASGKVWFWIKRDMKVIEKQTGSIVPLDHKTTGWSIGDAWQRKWRMSSQLTGYVWATQMETGKICPFAYVNAIQVVKLPNSNKKCYTHQLKYSECRLEHTNFALLTYNREQYHLEMWRRDALTLAHRYQKIRQDYPDLEMVTYAPMEGTFQGMGGCANCEFSKYCRLGKDPKYADALLIYSPWRPWEEEGVKRVDWR